MVITIIVTLETPMTNQENMNQAGVSVIRSLTSPLTLPGSAQLIPPSSFLYKHVL